jgi:hypothetical protein
VQKRVEQLEVAQKANVEALKTSLESMRSMGDSTKWLMVGFAALLSIIVGVQTTATFSNLRQDRAARQREQEQYLWNTTRRDKWEQDNTNGVTKINSVLGVIQNTLKTRLDAEKEARKEAHDFQRRMTKLQEELVLIRQDLTIVKGDLEDSRTTVANELALLEEEAERLATTPRHDFRDRVEALALYAPKYDLFVRKHSHKKGEAEFKLSARAQYVRGIAAHYGNEPEVAQTLLKPLATIVSPADPQERRQTVEGKRSAVASYFLGLIESNFANYEEATVHFDLSIALEPEDASDHGGAKPRFKDVLSRLVAAEACAMSHDPGRTIVYLDAIRVCFADAIAKCERRRMDMPKYLVGLQGRTGLVHANMLLRQATEGALNEAMDVTKQLLGDSPSYFAMVTHGQLLMASGADNNEARKLFAEAYTMIRNRNDLVSVVELRSQILLLIVAGISARYSPGFEGMWEHHLDSAVGLLKRLPKRGTETCTVFSPFSKRNESPDTIETQISAFRERNVLLSVLALGVDDGVTPSASPGGTEKAPAVTPN